MGLLRRGDACNAKDRRINIGQLRQRVNLPVDGQPSALRRQNKTRYMRRPLKEHIFLTHVVIAQHLSVVRCENHPCILFQTVLPQAAEKPSQRVVHLRDHCIVGAAGVCKLLRGKHMHIGVLIAAGQEALRLFFQIF